MTGFEWDEDKAARNLIEHRVSFEQAALACRDPFAVEWIDERDDYGEERIGLLGLYGREVLFVRFEGQSHGLSRGGHAKLRLKRLHFIMDWFEKYLK